MASLAMEQIDNSNSVCLHQLSPEWEPVTNNVKYMEGVGIYDVTRRSRRLNKEQLLRRCKPGDLIELECHGEHGQDATWFVYIGNGDVVYAADNEVQKNRFENVFKGGKGCYHRMDKGIGGPLTPKCVNIVKAASSEVKKEVQDKTWINSEQFVTWCCFPRQFQEGDDQSNTSNGYLDIYCETLSPYTISGITVSRKGDIWCCRTDWTAETTIVVARQEEGRIIATGTIRKGGCYFFGISVTTEGDIILVGRQGCVLLSFNDKGQFIATKFAESILSGCIVRAVCCRAGNVYVKCVEEGRQDTYMAMCQVLTFTETGDFIRALQLRAPLEGHIAVQSDGNVILTEFSCVRVFDRTGNHVNDCNFNSHIEGLAVDTYDNIITTTNSHVCVLDPALNEIHSFDLRPFCFTDSPGLAVTPDGDLVVVDKSCSRRTKGCRILVFNVWPTTAPRTLESFHNTGVTHDYVYKAIPHSRLTGSMDIRWGPLLNIPNGEAEKMADEAYVATEQVYLEEGDDLNRATSFDDFQDTSTLRRTFSEPINRVPDQDQDEYDWPKFLTPGYFCKACWVFCCLLCIPVIGVLIFIACHRQILPPIVRKYGRKQGTMSSYLSNE